MGNFTFKPYGDEKNASETYLSPGHNSAYYQSKTGQYFLIFHTRFKGTGDNHQVRVHEMFMNEEGWPVVSPHRYSGVLKGKYNKSEYVGRYKMVNHGTAISRNVFESQLIELSRNNTISGDVTGTWSIDPRNSRMITMKINGENYKGVFNYQKDPANDINKMTFSVCCTSSNVCIWGSKAE
jgi:arabinan endo-1,5-alpha-L-arabinosidase